MTVELVDMNQQGQAMIAEGASICYNSPKKDLSRIKRLKQSGHLATYRFAYATFLIEDVSRACANQFVRSKHLDYLQESQRYVNQADRGFVSPDLSYIDTNKLLEAEMLIHRTARQASQVYETLLKLGVKKEDARSILPLNTKTSLYVTGSLQAWVDFLKLRETIHAQTEIREVAKLIRVALASKFPLVFDDEAKDE